MADESTKECLNNWGCGDLVDLFAEQEITYDCLKSLSADIIKELIPVIGKRVKFTDQWKRTFSIAEPAIQPQTTPASSTLHPSSGPSSSQTSRAESDSDSDQESVVSFIGTRPNTSNKRKNFTGESEYRKRVKNIEGGEYLNDLLERRSNLADPLLSDYKQNNRLSNKSSFLLCDCIADDLVVDKYSKFTTQDYIDLTNQIKKWFPSEDATTYFRPGVPKRLSKNNKSKKPGGRLYDKIKNRKSLFAKLTGTVRRRGQPENKEKDEAVHVKDAGDIEKVHEDIVKQMRKRHTTVQPYIVGIGASLKEVNSFMLIIDKPVYCFDSPLTALAACFKIFYVWNIQFPLQSKQIYIFLQEGIFKFTTDTDEKITHVSKLLELINSTE